jgi:hypothetical protein
VQFIADYEQVKHVEAQSWHLPFESIYCDEEHVGTGSTHFPSTN